jgi:hypothetical protein
MFPNWKEYAAKFYICLQAKYGFQCTDFNQGSGVGVGVGVGKNVPTPTPTSV